MRSLATLIGASCLLVTGALAQTDPPTYFGGTDNEFYLDWVADRGSEGYDNSIFLAAPSGGSAVHWRIMAGVFHLAVAVRAEGWVAFGFSENGGMKGADVVTFTAATEELMDGYILTNLAAPFRDDCQNWSLLDSRQGDGFIIFEASRYLDTGDAQDRVILNDAGRLTSPTRIISAWGDTPEVGYHGPSNRVRDSVILFGSSDDDSAVGDVKSIFAQEMADEAEGSIVLQIQNHPVPVTDTVYDLFCFSWQDMVSQGLPDGTAKHIIGIEAMIDPNALKYVHHLVIAGSTQEWSETGDCQFFPKLEVLYIWAAGEPPFTLPKEAGFALDEGRGFKSFQLDIHYNNPWLDTNQFDNSGFKLYWTSQKREHDMGVATFGDPLLGLQYQPVGNGLVEHTVDCPVSCTNAVLQQEATIVKSFLHMHATGTAMHHSQMRNGSVIHESKVEFFDYSQTGLFSAPEEPFTMQPGDTFQTKCFYESNDSTEFGYSSQQEMCIAFYFYYPRQWAYNIVPFVCGVAFGDQYGLPDCDAKYQGSRILDDPAPLERTFGTPSADATCGSGDSSGAVRPECFSGDMAVETRDGSIVRLKNLELGTEIKVGEAAYEAVYSFGHFGKSASAEFLQFQPSGLEITADHMVFLDNERAIPASMVKVGDELLDGAAVSSIKTVVKLGLYAPFTPSGKLLVNGVKVSSYVSFQDSDVLVVGGIKTPFTYQWLAHSFQFPHRFYCQYVGNCSTESYNEDGLSMWIVRPYKFVRWLLAQNTIIMGFVMSLSVLIAGAGCVLEQGSSYLLLAGLVAYAAAAFQIRSSVKN